MPHFPERANVHVFATKQPSTLNVREWFRNWLNVWLLSLPTSTNDSISYTLCDFRSTHEVYFANWININYGMNVRYLFVHGSCMCVLYYAAICRVCVCVWVFISFCLWFSLLRYSWDANQIFSYHDMKPWFKRHFAFDTITLWRCMLTNCKSNVSHSIWVSAFFFFFFSKWTWTFVEISIARGFLLASLPLQ